MTPIARFKACGPSDFSVVTNAAELALSDRIHGDLIGACLHLEWCRMAGVTFKSDPMKPMRKRSHRYSSVATFAFEKNVAVYSQSRANEEAKNENKAKEHGPQGAGSRQHGAKTRGQRSEVRDQRSGKADLFHFRLTPYFRLSTSDFGIFLFHYFPPAMAGWHLPHVVAGNATLP